MDTYNLPPMFSSALSPQSGALADDEAHRNHWIFDPFALFLIIMYLVAGTLSFFQLLGEELEYIVGLVEQSRGTSRDDHPISRDNFSRNIT